MENMDHDKVLIRMDGSRRLTTRNRRFVKQILSPPDLPEQDVPSVPVQDVPSVPVQRHGSSPVVDSADKSPIAQHIPENSDNVDRVVDIERYQSGSDSGACDEGDGIIDVANDDITKNVQPQPQSPVSSGSILQPTVGRPKRDRKPNVKYSSEEYELASVSASKRKLVLSGMFVKQGRLKNRGRC